MKIKKGMMVKGILIVLFIWYITYGIHRCQEEGDVVKLEFNEFNPSKYDLPFNIDTVVNAIMVTVDNNSNDYIFLRLIDRKGYDFIIESDGYNQSSYLYVYRNNLGRRIREGYKLLVTLEPLNKDITRVTVRKNDPILSYGVKFWRDPTFKYYLFKFHAVKTPAIQEYDFIRLLGKRLGYLKNMPFTKYPKELSQKQILSRFGGNIPFSIDDIFEYPEKDIEEWYKQNK